MRRTPEGLHRILALGIGVGLLWLAVEVVVNVATLPELSVPELGTRLLRVLPWHVAIFAGWGVALALVARGRRARAATLFWCGIGAGTFSFLGARLLESLMRTGGPAAAAIGVVAAAIGTGLALATLAGAARLLPAVQRPRWHAAAGIAWILGVVLILGRAGYAIGHANGDLATWLAVLDRRDLWLLGLPLGAALLASPRPHAFAVLAGIALLATPLCAALARPSPALAARATPAPGTPDVLVLVLDTLRGDHVGRVVEGRSLTPRLDALAADAIEFSHAFAPSNWTRGSMPGLLASLPYRVVGNVPTAHVATFATELQRAGFHTAGASANPLVSARLGWAHGYDTFVDPDSMGDLLVAHPLQMFGAAATAPAYRIGAVTNAVYFRDAAEMRRRALDLLDRAPRPAFLHLQTMDTHGPYLPPHRFLPSDFAFGAVSSYYTFMQLRGRGVITSDAFRPQLENFRQRYAASVRHLDAEVGALLDGLRARGRYDEALIWVVADHGEAFGEHDVAGHTGLSLCNELVRVPLLLKLPKSWGVAPRTEVTAVSTFSMLPTTLAVLGLPVPAELFGADLTPLVRDGTAPPPGPLFLDSSDRDEQIYGAIRWPWKLVTRAHDDGPLAVEGLFDLASSLDDARSAADAAPEQVAALLAETEAYRARVAARAAHSGSGRIDPATEEQLRKLGYVE